MPDDLRNPDSAAAFASAVIAKTKLKRVHVSAGDATEAAREIAFLIAKAGQDFERNGPVTLKRDPMTGLLRAQQLTEEAIIIKAHRVCQPFVNVKKKDEFEEKDVAMSYSLAKLILHGGEWELPPLHGITTGPVLDDAGGIWCHDGYHAETGLWCDAPPDIGRKVKARPTRDDASAALFMIRSYFHTFPFADAIRIRHAALGVDVVDLTKPPGAHESAFLAALLTGACRPSLHLSPGFLIRAPAMSGAGTGKGLLARAICLIAFGAHPRAFTGGSDPAELDKRIGAELIEASPALLLDNLNATVLKSDALASVLTERPARVRVLGLSKMATLNATALVLVTGNGLSVSEDLARRFIAIDLDAGLEDPEARPFQGDFLAHIETHRAALLAAVLTVWRWGRHEGAALAQGQALGSFGAWCRWCRDPLLALGCRDPVAGIADAKANDQRRQMVAELLAAWFACHHDYPTKATDLHEEVRAILDPQGRGRQHVAATLAKLAGTRIAGLVLTASKPAGRWGATTYAVSKVQA